MIKIAGIEFDNYPYDADGDVLHLSVGEPGRATETDATPEGPAEARSGEVLEAIMCRR